MELLKYDNIKLVVNKEEAFIYYATFIAGEYSFLKIGRDDVVLDAGASIGDFTVIASRMAKRVIAIEPNPNYLKLLEENLKLNNVNNVEILPFAIGSTEGKTKFKLDGVTSSLAEEGVEVEVKPLDSLVSYADVIKMDIEGAEKYAVKSSVVRNAREIVMELHGNDNVEFIPRYLRELGFKVKEITFRDLLKNALRNSILHLPSLIDAELKTNFYATRAFLRKRGASTPSVSQNEYKLIYAFKLHE